MLGKFRIISEHIDTGNASHQIQTPAQGFDSTGIIEQIIQKISAGHANTMKAIVKIMGNQQQQMNKVINIPAELRHLTVQNDLGLNIPSIVPK